jgi:poly(3-hydroxybutyrate) depolymerase
MTERQAARAAGAPPMTHRQPGLPATAAVGRGHAAWSAAALACLLAVAGCSRQHAEPARDAALPRLPIDPQSVTVSGISAGGYMAVQMHVAHSALVHGAGVLAAGPYLCAEGSMRHALGRCIRGDEPIPTGRLLETTSHLALEGRIDPIAGLADDRVWIFHGAADQIVRTPVVDALETYYAALVDPAHIARTEHPTAGHTFPTDRGGAACEATQSPFLGDCAFDAAGKLLEHLYGPLEPDAAADPVHLVQFDQSGYAAAGGSRSLAPQGWLYVPTACATAQEADCRLHVVFHGCKQGASFVGDVFVRGSGYLEAAEANRIVLLFPQLLPSFQPLNPNGCWDWWGYEGEDYATQAGPQIRAVRAMIADLMSATSGSP